MKEEQRPSEEDDVLVRQLLACLPLLKAATGASRSLHSAASIEDEEVDSSDPSETEQVSAQDWIDTLLKNASTPEEEERTLKDALAEQKRRQRDPDGEAALAQLRGFAQETFVLARGLVDAADDAEEERSDLILSFDEMHAKHAVPLAAWALRAEKLMRLERGIQYLQALQSLHALQERERNKTLLQEVTLLRTTSTQRWKGTHLMRDMDTLATACYTHVRDELDERIQVALARADWPKTTEYVLQADATQMLFLELKTLFAELTQMSKEAPEAAQRPFHRSEVAYALTQKPLISFHFHFDGKRPTNRPDKPEWFLSHTLKLLSTIPPFLSKVEEEDRLAEIISIMLCDAIQPKIATLASTLPVTPSAPLLAHLIRELLDFDAELVQMGYAFDAQHCGASLERGTAALLLSQEKYLMAWLDTEQQHGETQVAETLRRDKAFEPILSIDKEDAEEASDVPTVAADSLLRQLDAMRKLLVRLPTDTLQALFLQHVLLPMMQKVIAFGQMHPTATTGSIMQAKRYPHARAVLCKFWGGYLSTMTRLTHHVQAWLDLPAFIALDEHWAQEEGPADRPFPLTQWLKMAQEEIDRWHDVLHDVVFEAWKGAARDYEKGRWTMGGDGAVSRTQRRMDPMITQAFASLQQDVLLLQKKLPETLFYRWMTDLRLSIDTWWYDRLILRHRFTQEGALQMQFDLLSGAQAVRLLHPAVVPGPTPILAHDRQNATLRSEAALRLLVLSPEKWQRLMTDMEEEEASTLRDILADLGVSILDADDIEDLSDRRI